MLVVPLPPIADLEKLFSGLLQRTVKIVKSPGECPDSPRSIALYRTDDPILELAVVCDLPLAASLAAALSVVPASAVKESIASGRLDESLRDNFAEVMNVVSRFVSNGAGRRFSLKTVSCPPEEPGEKLWSAVEGSDEKRELSAEVAGYQNGRIAFCTL